MTSILTATPAARKPYTPPRPRDRAARLAHLIVRAEQQRCYREAVWRHHVERMRGWEGPTGSRFRAAEAMLAKTAAHDARRLEQLRRALAGLEGSDPAKAPRIASDEPAGVGTGIPPVGPDDADRAFVAGLNEGGAIVGEAGEWERNFGSWETLEDMRQTEAQRFERMAEAREALRAFEDRWA